MLTEMLKNMNINEEANDEEEIDIDFLDEHQVNVMDECSRTQFHTSMILPEAKAMIDEPEIELNILP
jgi:hypothetical protein